LVVSLHIIAIIGNTFFSLFQPAITTIVTHKHYIMRYFLDLGQCFMVDSMSKNINSSW